MKRLVIIILFLLFAVAAKAQIAIDTLSAEALNELLIEQVERMAEDSDDDIDYEELLDYYIFLSEKRAAHVEKPKKNTQTMSKKLQRKYGKK